MLFPSETFASLVSGDTLIETTGSDGSIIRSYRDSSGNFTGRSVAKTSGDRTTTQFFDATMELVGSERVVVSDQITTSVYNASGQLQFSVKVTERSDYTLTETFGADWVKQGAVKEIHTATTTGVQNYDANSNLISAHLETDNGKGYTTVTDYGLNWAVLSRTTVQTDTTSAGQTRVVTEHQENGVVTGGTIVTTRADYTLTETFGPGWVKQSGVKEIHTATTTGVQNYDGAGILVSAHLETDNGKGYTTVTDYGLNWAVLARTTVRTEVTANGITRVTTEETEGVRRVVTEHQENGVVIGGTIVTTRADYTLTETFGPGWVKQSGVKEIHTATTTGVQNYDGAGILVSAHLETDNGKGNTTVTDYGLNWIVLARTTVQTKVTVDGVTRVTTDLAAGGDSRVVTEHLENGVVTGGTIVTTRADYTRTETFGTGWVKQKAVKEIHTATTTGVQNYDGNEVLVSAHLETNDGHGNTSVTDYGPNWAVLSRTTVQTDTTSAGETRVVTRNLENGVVTDGTIVTTRADYTLTETFGPGWIKQGAIKELHTTTTGVQNYDGAGILVSAHLETDDGHGNTSVTDYGPDWTILARTTVQTGLTPEGDPRVVTRNLENGVVTGGAIVTTRADDTLTETFGPGWVKQGAVKEIHTATTTGVQNYDASGTLVSAHLKTDDGKGNTSVTDYGPDWTVISRTTEQTGLTSGGDSRVVTEHQENGAGNVVWTTIRVGSGENAETRHIGSAVDNVFVGDVGKDTMIGDAGNDSLSGMGNSDDLQGGLGDDYLDGGASNDKLSGNEGNDTLVGGSGNDILSGGSGLDILIGGAGRDTMTGGGQSDRFVFNSRAESGITDATRDVIKDFAPGADTIDLSGMDANGSIAGDPAFQFVAPPGAAFSGTAGELIWSQVDNAGTDADYALIEGDINGDALPDFQIMLLGLQTLSQNDFVL